MRRRRLELRHERLKTRRQLRNLRAPDLGAFQKFKLIEEAILLRTGLVRVELRDVAAVCGSSASDTPARRIPKVSRGRIFRGAASPVCSGLLQSLYGDGRNWHHTCGLAPPGKRRLFAAIGYKTVLYLTKAMGI